MNQAFLPLDDSVIFDHLSGHNTIGVYPLLEDGTCLFLAADFDQQTWQDDVVAFHETCRSLGVPATIERSRSHEERQSVGVGSGRKGFSGGTGAVDGLRHVRWQRNGEADAETYSEHRAGSAGGTMATFPGETYLRLAT